MEIKFLKAGSGDSILIHHKKFNILIDGGNDSKYLLSEITNIYKRKEVIDLLVITHHDDDHIKGIIEFLKLLISGEFGNKDEFVKQVVFNSPRLFHGKIIAEKDRLLSYRQAHEVEELLQKISVKWEVYTNESPPMNFEDLKIEFLSPVLDDVKVYNENKGAFLSDEFKCDWNSPLNKLFNYVSDDSLDRSLSNRSSVVLRITCEGKKVLLTGDVTPDRLEKIIEELVRANGGEPVSFDYIKLPHHGSYRSVSKGILQNVNCSNYIISTNSKKHFLPNKRCLLKVLKYRNSTQKARVNFIFNYAETVQNLNINSKERSDYNFVLIPNNKDYGYAF